MNQKLQVLQESDKLKGDEEYRSDVLYSRGQRWWIR
jgi:hypothetical protein